MTDTIATSSCPHCATANDASFRLKIQRLQAADFGDAAAAAEVATWPSKPDPSDFDGWLAEVDQVTTSMVQQAHDQLPTWYWFDAFNLGLSTHEAAHFAIEDAHNDAVDDGWYLARYSEASEQ